MDPLKVQYAQHNAQLYGLSAPEQLQLVHTDYLRLSDKLAIP